MTRSSTPQIRFTADTHQLYLAFEQRATHEVSLAAESLVLEFLDHHPTQPAVALDLTRCQLMDSTFAGWLLKLRRRLRQSEGRVVFAGCSDSCRETLEIMGLAALFPCQNVPAPAELHTVHCDHIDETNPDAIEFMLHAHEDLAAVNPANERTFTPVTDLLRRELDKKKRS